MTLSDEVAVHASVAVRAAEGVVVLAIYSGSLVLADLADFDTGVLRGHRVGAVDALITAAAQKALVVGAPNHCRDLADDTKKLHPKSATSNKAKVHTAILRRKSGIPHR
eukprot:GHUV01031135.1.p2 GENE.GHUV01031135.1~~GHUV01031135.1.p2  ORF type:complete len:109 (+),score=15.10 GHUV01031135.1:34-360(+)